MADVIWKLADIRKLSVYGKLPPFEIAQIEERDIHSLRIKSGLRLAEQKGKRFGAKEIWPYYADEVKRLKRAGYNLKEIGEELDIDYRTVKKALKAKDGQRYLDRLFGELLEDLIDVVERYRKRLRF